MKNLKIKDDGHAIYYRWWIKDTSPISGELCYVQMEAFRYHDKKELERLYPTGYTIVPGDMYVHPDEFRGWKPQKDGFDVGGRVHRPWARLLETTKVWMERRQTKYDDLLWVRTGDNIHRLKLLNWDVDTGYRIKFATFKKGKKTPPPVLVYMDGDDEVFVAKGAIFEIKSKGKEHYMNRLQDQQKRFVRILSEA